MHTGELLYLIAEHGVSLRCSRTEDRLHYASAGTLPPELMAELKERKQEVIRILEKARSCGGPGRSGQNVRSSIWPAITSGKAVKLEGLEVRWMPNSGVGAIAFRRTDRGPGGG